MKWEFCTDKMPSTLIIFLRPVVQSMISPNPGLNFNLPFLFMHFCSTVHFKTLKHNQLLNNRPLGFNFLHNIIAQVCPFIISLQQACTHFTLKHNTLGHQFEHQTPILILE